MKLWLCIFTKYTLQTLKTSYCSMSPKIIRDNDKEKNIADAFYSSYLFVFWQFTYTVIE